MRDRDDVTAWAMLAQVVALAAFLIWHGLLRRHQRRVSEGLCLEPVARSLGLAASRGSASAPFVKFDLQGLPAIFSFTTLGSYSFKIVSRLEIRTGSEAFLEITSRRAAGPPTWSARFRSVPLPSHYVMTSDPAWARAVLTEEVVGHVSDLESALKAPLRFRATSSSVTIETERRLSVRDLDVLLNRASRLLASLGWGSPAKGIELEDARFAGERGCCPVCRAAAAGAAECAACRAPHHKECWAYVGRCAIFGCGALPP